MLIVLSSHTLSCRSQTFFSYFSCLYLKFISKLVYTVDKICDGIFNCLHGEDETFELCKDTFPEEATIECIEDRLPGIDLKVMAIPCNGIRECRHGSDEECEDDKLILIFVVSGLVTVTMVMYLYLLWIEIPQWRKSFLREVKVNDFDGRNHIACFNSKGNYLASLKVIQAIASNKKVFEIMIYF